jgi:radical SAM superfamily enzyme with C-terminal helix-hairpin-helix motif
MFDTGLKLVNKHKALFKKFKRKVQEEIERPMLEKMLPQGSVLKQIYTEKHIGKLTFARQVGSYPLLVGVPGIFDLGKFIDVRIVDYGFRSITGIPYPLNVNTASRETLEAIPGIGKKRAIRILASRPFEKSSDLKQIFDDTLVFEQVKNYFDI